jgi:hypothetical protein
MTPRSTIWNTAARAARPCARMKAVAHRDPKGIGLGMQQIGQGMTEVTKRRHQAAASGHSLDLAPATNAPRGQEAEMLPLPAFFCVLSWLYRRIACVTGVAPDK